MRYVFLFILTLLFVSLHAQPGNPATADSASLRAQYEAMLGVSNNYQQFKVVRRDFLGAFINNVSDSISGYTEKIGRLETTITSQAQRLEEQAKTISTRDSNIAKLTGEKDGMSWLGIPMSKGLYRIIMWSAIGVLALLLLLSLARMRLAVAGSNEAEAKAVKLSEELDKSKRRRLEVEQNLRRQLQDEINKRNTPKS